MSEAPAVLSPRAWTQLTLETDKAAAARIAAWLESAGALAVTLSDAGDEPLFEPAPGDAPLWDRTRLCALLPDDAKPHAVLGALRAELAPLPLHACRVECLEDRDWVRTSVQDFRPLRFGRRLWVTPTWCEPPPGAEVVVRLDPGLAFGTGTHATTALCLDWLDDRVHPGERMVDYGCGSGILAVAGLALGAAHALAVDSDPQALAATRGNAALNGCGARIEVAAPESVAARPADLLVANILAGPLIALAPRLAGLVRPGGALALSGVLADQAATVAAAYASHFELSPPVARGEWVRIDGRRRA